MGAHWQSSPISFYFRDKTLRKKNRYSSINTDIVKLIATRDLLCPNSVQDISWHSSKGPRIGNRQPALPWIYGGFAVVWADSVMPSSLGTWATWPAQAKSEMPSGCWVHISPLAEKWYLTLELQRTRLPLPKPLTFGEWSILFFWNFLNLVTIIWFYCKVWGDHWVHFQS